MTVLLDAHDAVLCDLDGVVYLGREAIPAAVTALRQAREKGVATGFVTNNAGRSATDVAEHLQELGVMAGPEQVMTSGDAAAALLGRLLEPGSGVYVAGSPALRDAVVREGLVPASVDEVLESPSTSGVVQGFDPELRWSSLNEATRCVRAGATWVAANLDATRPTDLGVLPGTGMMIHAVEVATGKHPQVAGKPHRPVFDAAVARASSSRPLFVGDRLDTDIAGARAAGITSLWVLSGAHGPLDALRVAADQLPDHVAADLAGVLEPEVEVVTTTDESGRSRASSGECAVDVDGSTATASGTDVLSLLRCVIALRRAGIEAEYRGVFEGR